SHHCGHRRYRPVIDGRSGGALSTPLPCPSRPRRSAEGLVAVDGAPHATLSSSCYSSLGMSSVCTQPSGWHGSTKEGRPRRGSTEVTAPFAGSRVRLLAAVLPPHTA